MLSNKLGLIGSDSAMAIKSWASITIITLALVHTILKASLTRSLENRYSKWMFIRTGYLRSSQN